MHKFACSQGLREKRETCVEREKCMTERWEKEECIINRNVLPKCIIDRWAFCFIFLLCHHSTLSTVFLLIHCHFCHFHALNSLSLSSLFAPLHLYLSLSLSLSLILFFSLDISFFLFTLPLSRLHVKVSLRHLKNLLFYSFFMLNVTCQVQLKKPPCKRTKSLIVVEGHNDIKGVILPKIKIGIMDFDRFGNRTQDLD